MCDMWYITIKVFLFKFGISAHYHSKVWGQKGFLMVLKEVSFKFPSEIILKRWFGAQETFLIIVNVENGCAA